MLEIGSLVDGKYKVLNKVGQGGMSVVYLAMNEKANKQWAIKEVRKDGIKDFEVVKQGLDAEINILKRLNHPNLPSIIDVIDQEDSFIIIMDYIEGNSLNKALEEYGAQSQQQVIEWAKQLCDVLGYLHSRTPAIIYRDMKPANIMLKPDGNVTLIDFGTAREFKEKNLADTTCLGTVGYAAPEQFGGIGQTDARTDIYCLGATLYHLVTGRNPCEPPYEIRPIREINPELSSGFERILLKCTQRNPEDRYQNAEELMYALEHYEQLDDIYRKKQKKKMAIFLTASILTIASATTSVFGYISAENKKSENYEYILTTADDCKDYYDAILTSPSRTEAYLGTNDYKGILEFLVEDGELTAKEAKVLKKFLVGLEARDSKGYEEIEDVMAELRKKNPDGYADVCHAFGETFLFNYNVSVEKDRYANAAQWFQHSRERHPIGQIYCEISDCLNSIYQYRTAKTKQVKKMYDEYKKLWKKIQQLKKKSDRFQDLDSEILVWNLVVDMLMENVNEFVEVTKREELTQMLNEISLDAKQVTQSVLAEDIQMLQEHIRMTKEKLASVKR